MVEPERLTPSDRLIPSVKPPGPEYDPVLYGELADSSRWNHAVVGQGEYREGGIYLGLGNDRFDFDETRDTSAFDAVRVVRAADGDTTEVSVGAELTPGDLYLRSEGNGATIGTQFVGVYGSETTLPNTGEYTVELV